MLRIAVNTRLLLNRNMEGIGRYTYELFSRIVKAHPEHQFYFIFDRPYDQQFVFAENVTPIVVYPPVRHPWLARIWFDFTLRWKLMKLKPDVFFSPDAMNSLRPVCKTITVLHDINFEVHPEYMPFLWRTYYRRRSPLIAKRSDKVVTVSNYSKVEIAATYDLDEDHIEVIYNAVAERFRPSNESEVRSIREKYAESKPYFVFVGGLYHRKNLINLLRAFEIFKEEDNSGIKLILVGQVLKDADNIISFREQSKYKNDIIITGRIESDEEVRQILAGALALTYISTIEGFGLPIVEAMKCEVPVITSNTTCMPEIAGEAALYVNPLDPVDVARKMSMMATDESLRQQLIVQAGERCKLFDWGESAEKTWKVIEEVAQKEKQ